MTDKQYVTCNIAGEGKLFVEGNKAAAKFKIIDMSAEGINLTTKTRLLEGEAAKLKIRLSAGVVSAFIDLNGRVAKTFENGCYIEFVGLSEATKEEIDELMRDSCDM